MPFPKYIICAPETDRNKVTFDESKNKTELDVGAIANQKMVNAIRELSQLIKIADDIFGTMESDFRIIFDRTDGLNRKIQRCQEIVNNLNAKAVKVPVSSLSTKAKLKKPFKLCDVETVDKVSIFSDFPRPPAVDLLRDLAHGPSPPVVIPCEMVAPEAEGFTGTVPSSNESTHIYCRPVKVKDVCKPTSLNSADSDSQSKNMTSMDVPSSVVPIDVSGQSFSRMASFRRSLIHVDFLIRRKRKKDKRRNTVSEVDVKDLKDELQNIVNEECQKTMPNTLSTFHEIIGDTKNSYNAKLQEAECDKLSTEQNNNSANLKFAKKSDCTSVAENKRNVEDRNKHCTLTRQSTKCDVKLNEQESILTQYPGKRKPKSHIPISTTSAAMNVAVEMRQCNNVEKHSPVSNGAGSNIRNRNSNPECILPENRRTYESPLFTDDDVSQESWQSCKKRLQEKCRLLANKRDSCGNDSCKDTEASSSASSESITLHENSTVATSTESDTYFISSDESDNDSTDITYFEKKRGSSTSLGTVSDGSLNSLLSETATEMTSSTGTLTSVGLERVLTPPLPPPPPMILSATVQEKNIITKIPEPLSIGYNPDTSLGQKSNKTENVHKKTKKLLKPPKALKPQKPSVIDGPGNSTESSKNIFSSLVGLKTNTKEKSKSKKEVEKKTVTKTKHQPVFDMYGHNSPKKGKQISTFIKENLSPVIQNEEKNNLKSFSVNVKQADQLTESKSSGKIIASRIPYPNPPPTNYTQLVDLSKRNGNLAVNTIPPKYEHQVIVTPVQRGTDKGDRNIIYKADSVIKENNVNVKNSQYENAHRSTTINIEKQLPVPRIQRPQPPNTLHHERTNAARVVLDFDGKVIYSTNSLDRKHYNPSPTANMHNSMQKNFPETSFKGPQSDVENSYYNSCQNNYTQTSENYARSGYNSNIVSPSATKVYPSFREKTDQDERQIRSGYERYVTNESCTPKQTEDRRAIAHSQYLQYYGPENIQSDVPKRMVSRPNSFAGASSDTYLCSSHNVFLPDPNVSGLPVQETMLTKHNVNLHSKHMERINACSSEDGFSTPSNSFYSSPSSEKSCGNIFNKSPQSTMSTEDLFAVIHDCKKRMNIKTDSDISLASSSRSSSPSCLRPSSSRGTLAETGFLSPRNHTHLETSGDRRSWADFRPVDSICNERKSLASDRLGPTKPTSMHDFKMLLLQARSSSQISGPRKSAVEMLKVPLSPDSQNNMNSLPLKFSPRNSFSVPNSPSSDLSIYNGHSTVPFKRGNRARTSLQYRYTMYPPIFEDCSEDMENSNDLQTDKPTDRSAIESVKDNNLEWNHNSNTSHKLKTQGYSCDSENNFQFG